MTATSPLVEVLQERLKLVQDLSRVNARHLLNQQIAGGAEFEIMQVEREIRESGPSQTRAAALQEARDRGQQAHAAMSVDSENMTALEDQLAELDQRIARRQWEVRHDMNMMAADSTTLYGLLARHWTVGSAVEGLEFDGQEDIVAFRLGNGQIALARMMDAEPPSDRFRMAVDNGRATISPRSKPVPPVTQLALDEAPLHLAAFVEGSFLAGGRGGHLVRVLGSGVVEPLADVAGPITAIASRPGGGALAATSSALLACDPNGVVRLLASIDTPISALSVAPDGRQIAVGSATGVLISSLEAVGAGRHFAIGGVRGLSWSPDGKWLAASIEQGGVALLRLADGKTIPIPDYPAPALSLAWSADSRLLVTSGAFRIVTWNLGTLANDGNLPESLETGRAGLMAVEAVAVHPARPLVAAGYGNGMVVVAQIGKRDELVVKTAGDAAIRALRWSRDGQHLALGTEGGQAAIVTFPPHLFK